MPKSGASTIAGRSEGRHDQPDAGFVDTEISGQDRQNRVEQRRAADRCNAGAERDRKRATVYIAQGDPAGDRPLTIGQLIHATMLLCGRDQQQPARGRMP